jgi:hypothetical protein
MDSWEWYKYHAQQRLAGFNFFVVFTGAVIVFLQQSKGGDPVLFRLGAVAGAAVSVGFYLLDVRNTQLVEIGSDAIIEQNGSLATMVKGARDHLLRVGDFFPCPMPDCWPFRLRLRRLRDYACHKFVLRAVMLCAAGVFVYLAIRGIGRPS